MKPTMDRVGIPAFPYRKAVKPDLALTAALVVLIPIHAQANCVPIDASHRDQIAAEVRTAHTSLSSSVHCDSGACELEVSLGGKNILLSGSLPQTAALCSRVWRIPSETEGPAECRGELKGIRLEIRGASQREPDALDIESSSSEAFDSRTCWGDEPPQLDGELSELPVIHVYYPDRARVTVWDFP
jgi:hypothetical protein